MEMGQPVPPPCTRVSPQEAPGSSACMGWAPAHPRGRAILNRITRRMLGAWWTMEINFLWKLACGLSCRCWVHVRQPDSFLNLGRSHWQVNKSSGHNCKGMRPSLWGHSQGALQTLTSIFCSFQDLFLSFTNPWIYPFPPGAWWAWIFCHKRDRQLWELHGNTVSKQDEQSLV